MLAMKPARVLLLLGLFMPWAVQVTQAKCRCPKASIEKKFKDAHAVVHARLLSQRTSCHLCDGNDRTSAIRIYTLYTIESFKGKSPGPKSVFKAQSYENLNFCGVRLVDNETYMLNLQDKRKISTAGPWNPSWYVLSQCDGHKNWKDVAVEQDVFDDKRR